MSPSPKLPTQSPSSVRVSPHGALRFPFETRRLRKFPLVSNTLTKPQPAQATSSSLEPSSLTKMKRAGAEVPFFVTWKDDVLLKTIPVGFAVPLFRLALGISTTRELAVPS